jgi:deazaflavin-dependent oxidoreductase (nitroreductase family)
MADVGDIREHNRALIEEFRSNGRQLGDRPLLLLTTLGRRTGRLHTTPMMYVRVGDQMLVIASNAGARKHPHWYLNLAANPSVTVEVAGEEYEATAVVPIGTERDQLFASVVEQYPFFADHQAGITRKIPVVTLVRRS